MACPQSDFKAIGGRLLRSQYRESTPPTTDSEESTFMRCIDYSGDSNSVRSRAEEFVEGQKFEVMIDTVILAERTLKAVRGTYIKCIGVKLRWRFLGKDATSRIVQVRGNEIPVSELYTYYIPTDSVSTFFNDRVIHFDVFAVYPNKEKLVGFSELNLCDCAENLNMHLGKCLDLLYITKQKCCSGSKTKNKGRLLIQYKLHSPPPQEKAPVSRQLLETLHKYPYTSFSSLSSKAETESKCSNCELKIKNTCNEEVFKTVSETCIQEGKKSIVDNQEYLFDFFPISSTLKQQDIKRKVSLPNIPSNKLSQLHQTAITIIINSLKFNEDFGKTLKQNMTYYIEYSFLRKEGLETLNFPLSSDYSTIFNAMTTFKLDLKKNIKDYRTLAKMISTNKTVKFNVVEEPITDVTNVPICVEIGYSDINLYNLIYGENNNTEYPLLSMKSHEPIGILNVEIIGLKNVIDIVQRRKICGISYEKAKSLDNLGDKEKEEVQIETGIKPNDEIHKVFLKETQGGCNKPSLMFKNIILKERNNFVMSKTTNKFTRGDTMTSLNIYRRSMSTKRKKIDRTRLNRRGRSLIGSEQLLDVKESENKCGVNGEKSETEETKEKDVGDISKNKE